MKLSQDQSEYVERVVNEPTRSTLISLETGDGKTVVALGVVQATGVEQLLIIAPLNTKDGWQHHVQVMLPNLTFKVIDSSAKGSTHFQQLRAKEPGAYFATKDYFALSGTSSQPREKKDGTMTKGRIQTRNWRFSVEMIILDESHNANNRDTASYKVLRQVQATWKLALSATPAGNKFHRLWETTRWLWPEQIDRSKKRWEAEWCRTEYNPFNYSHTEVVGEKVPGAFVASLPCYIKSKTSFKIPTTTISVKTPLTAKQREQYASMLKNSLLWIDEHPLVAELPIVQKIRLRQIALGEVTFDENGDVNFDRGCESTKIEACKQIIARHPNEPIVFYTDSKRFAYVLAHRIGGSAWTGDLRGPKRTELKKAFLEGKVQYIVAVINAFGVGTDGLQAVCSTEVWCNKSFNDQDNFQCEGRLNRRGQGAKEITRYVLTAPDSGDTIDFERLARNRKELRRSL